MLKKTFHHHNKRKDAENSDENETMADATLMKVPKARTIMPACVVESKEERKEILHAG